jgi:transposase InsO family protein
LKSSANILLTAADAAQLCRLSVRHIRRHCTAGKYTGVIKQTDGWIIPLNSLPTAAQLQYMDAQPATEASTPLAGLPVVATVPAAIDADAMHLAYRRAPKKSKARADRLCAAVMEFEELRATGETKSNAEAHVKAAYNISPATLWRARDVVKGWSRELWAALLLPCYKGRTKEAELTGDAWEWIQARWLSTSEPPAHVVIKEARKEGKARGWALPSDKTIIRKLNAMPAPIVLLGRKGKEVFDATFPAAERDFAAYGLHEVWVSDGRRVDVFCRWPDGTVSRPFIVAWCDMRTRKVLGTRGGVNPSGNLTLASFHAALSRAGIKPKRALLDNGHEYAAKSVTGGQKTRYRFKIKEGEPIGALTRMDVTADWARPYRGQEKPIESFWKYIANHLDKLPEFQGAYCGKNTVSKPEDLDRGKAIPIEIYAAKLAEVLEEFNRRPHRGRGMDGKSPAQLDDELMQADPHKEWARPTAEHLRLLCLEQRTLTLNNKDASISFKFTGYGEVRYWSEVLADLPMAARSKKYAVFHNPEDPDIPVVIYDGERMVCEAARIGAVGSKQAAAQHCINKAGFKKPRAAAFKTIRQAAPITLPTPAAPLSIQSVTIEKPATPVMPSEPPKLKELSPGVWYDPEQGKTIGKGKSAKPTSQLDDESIEKYRRIKEARESERMKRFGTA